MDFKVKVVRCMQQNEYTRREASAKFGVAGMTITRWMKDKKILNAVEDEKYKEVEAIEQPRIETHTSEKDVGSMLGVVLYELKNNLKKMSDNNKINFARLLKDIIKDGVFAKDEKEGVDLLQAMIQKFGIDESVKN